MSEKTRTVKAELARPTSSIAHMLHDSRAEIARALPQHMSVDRFARIALTVVRRNPDLGKCTPESFLGALMTAAQLGLEPGPLGHAYLIPYGQECTFVVGYRGLIDLARRSGYVRKISARIVHENDEFDYQFGVSETLHHRPVRTGEHGKATHAYAVLWLVDGDPDIEVMTVAEVEAVRSRSKAPRNGPWVTDWEEMAKKTVLRRIAKRAPVSIEWQRAVNADEQVRVDIGPDALDIAPTEEAVEVNTEWPPARQPGSGQPANQADPASPASTERDKGDGA